MVFKDAKKLGLQGQGEGCNFIEEERSAVGHLDVPRARFCGTGECAPFAAEEFRFDEILGKRGTIEPDVRLVGSATERDNGASG